MSSLDGDEWQLRGCLGNEWEWHVNKPWDARYPRVSISSRSSSTLRRRASRSWGGRAACVDATLRRGAGVVPWQFNESYPNAWCTGAVDYHGVQKPAYYGVACAHRGAPSAQFATSAWGGRGEAHALVSSPARFVNLDASVVAESQGGEIRAALDEFAADVFVLDLGENRYVMTRTDTLEPLLDLPPARVEAELVAQSHKLVLRHVGGPAALGIVIEVVICSDNVIDLLPGEERTIEVDASEAPLFEGWNVRG